MPIESPSPIGNKTHSEFVLCEGFAFRPSTVDGCSHQKYADGSAVTVVNFKSYTQTLPTRSEGCSISTSANSSPSAPMKPTDLLIYVLGIAGALVGYFVLQPPLSWAAIVICAAFTLWTLLGADAATKPVLRLAGLSWSMEDFVRGWHITGRTGSGKTQCAINTITYQIFQNVPHWGGVCLDLAPALMLETLGHTERVM